VVLEDVHGLVRVFFGVIGIHVPDADVSRLVPGTNNELVGRWMGSNTVYPIGDDLGNLVIGIDRHVLDLTDKLVVGRDGGVCSVVESVGGRTAGSYHFTRNGCGGIVHFLVCRVGSVG
jgi:hypothetical protein